MYPNLPIRERRRRNIEGKKRRAGNREKATKTPTKKSTKSTQPLARDFIMESDERRKRKEPLIKVEAKSMKRECGKLSLTRLADRQD